MLKKKVEKNIVEAITLENQVLTIRDELTSRDAAIHEERVRREAVIQDVTSQRNCLQAELAELQAEVLSVGHEKRTLENSLRESFQVASISTRHDQSQQQLLAGSRFKIVLNACHQ